MNPYALMASRINAMELGTALRISHREMNDLPGLPDWAFMANITTGFERVKESVVGSSFPDLWDFHQEFNGDITVYRKETTVRDMERMGAREWRDETLTSPRRVGKALRQRIASIMSDGDAGPYSKERAEAIEPPSEDDQAKP